MIHWYVVIKKKLLTLKKYLQKEDSKNTTVLEEILSSPSPVFTEPEGDSDYIPSSDNSEVNISILKMLLFNAVLDFLIHV